MRYLPLLCFLHWLQSATYSSATPSLGDQKGIVEQRHVSSHSCFVKLTGYLAIVPSTISDRDFTFKVLSLGRFRTKNGKYATEQPVLITLENGDQVPSPDQLQKFDYVQCQQGSKGDHSKPSYHMPPYYAANSISWGYIRPTASKVERLGLAGRLSGRSSGAESHKYSYIDAQQSPHHDRTWLAVDVTWSSAGNAQFLFLANHTTAQGVVADGKRKPLRYDLSPASNTVASQVQLILSPDLNDEDTDDRRA